MNTLVQKIRDNKYGSGFEARQSLIPSSILGGSSSRKQKLTYLK